MNPTENKIGLRFNQLKGAKSKRFSQNKLMGKTARVCWHVGGIGLSPTDNVIDQPILTTALPTLFSFHNSIMRDGNTTFSPTWDYDKSNVLALRTQRNNNNNAFGQKTCSSVVSDIVFFILCGKIWFKSYLSYFLENILQRNIQDLKKKTCFKHYIFHNYWYHLLWLEEYH